MRIVVCVKQIQHIYTRTGKNPDENYIAPEDAIYRINPYDEVALELAFGLRDTAGKGEICLLILGPLIAESELRRCLATGADHLYQVEFKGRNHVPPLSQPDPWIKADLIARVVKTLDADLVLCGKESLDRANGQVGALVAQHLNRPFVSAITDLSLDPGSGKVLVQRSAGRGVRETIESPLPAVFSVDRCKDLRLPTVAARKQADAYEIRRPDIGEQVVSAKMICNDIFQPRPRTKTIPPPDSKLNAFDRVLQLLSGSKVEKKGMMLTGGTESQVQGIIDFLTEIELLPSPDRRDSL
jgi:electron transfer flavoprotein beta subunit